MVRLFLPPSPLIIGMHPLYSWNMVSLASLYVIIPTSGSPGCIFLAGVFILHVTFDIF